MTAVVAGRKLFALAESVGDMVTVCQRVTVHAVVEAQPGLHAEADSHGLAVVVG